MGETPPLFARKRSPSQHEERQVAQADVGCVDGKHQRIAGPRIQEYQVGDQENGACDQQRMQES